MAKRMEAIEGKMMPLSKMKEKVSMTKRSKE
jgi:hypothetical protein